MNLRIPNPSTSAVVLKKYFSGIGISMTLAQAQEAVARLNGYADWRALRADARFADPVTLQAISSNEYELKPKETVAWIGIDDISAAIRRTDEGVIVDLYAKGMEDESICGTGLTFGEAAEFRESVPEEEWVAQNAQAEGFQLQAFSWGTLLDDRALVTHVKLQGKEHLVARILEVREDGLWVQYEPDVQGSTGAPFLYGLRHMLRFTEVSPGLFHAPDGDDLEFLHRDALGNYQAYSQVERKLVEPHSWPRVSSKY
jgi:hypothetical protein